MTRTLLLASLAIGALAAPLAAPDARAADAICYNCPPEWADWASMLRAIETELGLAVPHDNKNSGQTLAQLIAERGNPVADVAYFGVTFGIQAGREGVLAKYLPAGVEDLAEGLVDPDGRWFTIHQGTLGLFVNVDALGGDLDDFPPAIDFFKRLSQNDPIVPMQTSYARVVSGEIPILFDYDFNAYRAKYTEDGSFEFVLPCEGSIVVPYVMGLVEGAPNRENGERILDFIMSDEGQAIWTNAYLRPARPIALPEEVAARFLPASEYERAVAVDFAAMAAAQAAFGERYVAEVR